MPMCKIYYTYNNTLFKMQCELWLVKFLRLKSASGLGPAGSLWDPCLLSQAMRSGSKWKREILLL